MARPDTTIATPVQSAFTGSATIDDQTGFYSERSQKGLADVNSKAAEVAAPDPRLSDNQKPE